MTSTEPVYFPDDPFGPCKPVTSYTELIDAIRAKVGRMGLRYEDFDRLAGLPVRFAGKALGPSEVRKFSLEKVFDALRAAGLRLRVEDDPEQDAKMQARIKAKLIHPRDANQARYGNSASPISKRLMTRVYGHFLKEARKNRWANTTKQQRSEHARMMGMARIKKRREHAKRVRQAKHAANTRWISIRKRSRAERQAAAHRAANEETRAT